MPGNKTAACLPIEPKRKIDKTINKIKNSVGKALPEYKAEAAELCAQPLSTYPALCAYTAMNDSSQNCIDALERIDSKFHSIIPSEIIDELPRKVEKWSDNDRKIVAEAVWHSSYGHDFDIKLNQHIYQNIPQLLLLHPMKVVIDSAENAHIKSHQIVHGHLNATQDRYDNECNRLNIIDKELQKLREKYRQQLSDIVDFAEDECDDIIEELNDRANQLQDAFGLPKDSLVPLYDWSVQLGKTIDTFLTAIHKAIENDSNPECDLIETLPPDERQAISDVLVTLRKSGYTEYAKSGAHIKTDNKLEKIKVAYINDSIKKLAEVLARNMKTLLDRTAEREAERIQDALQVFVEGYAQLLNIDAQIIASDLAGLFITPSKLVRVKQRLLLSFNFITEIEIKSYVDYEKTTLPAISERRWYTLWLWSHTITEEQTITTPHNYDEATIPCITNIFIGLIDQAKASRLDSEFFGWLHSQLDEFLVGLDEYQENLLDEYRTRLDKAIKNASQEKEICSIKWQENLKLLDVFIKEIPLLKVN
jgi:hypothetical protein